MSKILKLFIIFNKFEKKNLIILLVMIIIMALLDIIGIASIMPFMSVLVDPTITINNVYLNHLYELSGLKTLRSFSIFLGVLTFILLIVSLIFKSFTTYFQIKFAMTQEFNFSKKLIENYLFKPYSWHLNKNSADLGKNILSEVQTIILNGLMPCLVIISNLAISFAILILLILIDPITSALVGIVSISFYVFVYIIMGSRLSKFGNLRLTSNKYRFTSVMEAFNAVKEIKSRNLEDVCIEKFSLPAKKYAQNQTNAEVIAQIPRFIFEGLAFGGMILVLLFLISVKRDFIDSVPLITLYAVAGYRLLPSLQMIYRGYSQLRFSGPSIDNLYNDLKNFDRSSINLDTKKIKIKVRKSIVLRNIEFSYESLKKPTLKNFSLNIKANTIVGLTGVTGSGKTTAIDIIMGLLKPEKGFLEIDGEKVENHNIMSWQNSIGYVPQKVYLVDESVEANIAFGTNKEKIDNLSIIESAKIAQIHDFIINDLPQGYKTNIGENGSKLSGGQRQRLGISRALYNNPDILIMDEATNALDKLTENNLMKSIYELRDKLTVILITHNIETLNNCDQIYFLENGSIKDVGTFNDLLNKNTSFKSMVSSLN